MNLTITNLSDTPIFQPETIICDAMHYTNTTRFLLIMCWLLYFGYLLLLGHKPEGYEKYTDYLRFFILILIGCALFSTWQR